VARWQRRLTTAPVSNRLRKSAMNNVMIAVGCA
jgi:hypothetical protein